MAAFNLFAKIDEFSSNDVNNYSFGELESSSQNVIDIPIETSPKKTTRGKRTRKIKAKTTVTPQNVLDCSDVETSDNEAPKKAGVGQKTAFKKLSKLKQSLETTAIIEPNKSRTRSAMNVSIREAYQQKRVKRTRLSQTTEVQHVNISAAQHTNIVNDSIDDDDISINIKIKWEGTSKIERIQFSMYKTFNELIAELSTRDKIDAASFLLMLGNNIIKPDDSPHSISYTLGKFISVRVVDNPNLYAHESTTSQCATIEVKIQYPKWKKPMSCNIKLTDPFKVLTGILAEKLQCNANKLRFKFDGDIVDISSTPADLDFDGGEILDLLMAE